MNKAGHCWRCEAPCTAKCSRCKVAVYCSKSCQKQDKWRHEPDCDAAEVRKKCNACAIQGEGMMKCANCQKVWYCGAECQKTDWKNHRTDCHETVEKILEVTARIRTARACLVNGTGGVLATYYWGNRPAVNLIKLSMNEGEEYSNPLALLLCGVGDPRDILFTVASLPDAYQQQVTFVMNDICPDILARTVLLLYMLQRGKKDVANTVIRVWYSLLITDEDHEMLTLALEELIATNDLHVLTKGVITVNANQLSKLKDVWGIWSKLAQRREFSVASLREKAASCDVKRENGIELYLAAIPAKHRKSAKDFIDTGIFSQTKDTEERLRRQNVTLTRSIADQALKLFSDSSDWIQYNIPSDIFPFTGWDYIAVKKVCCVDSLPEMYGAYLSQILDKFLEGLRRGQVKLHVVLEDCVQIDPFLPVGLRYDRITTSNLSDYIPLTTLLTKFKCFLNSTNPHAVLVTETMNWPNLQPEIFQLIALRAMFPIQNNLNERALKDTMNLELVKSFGMTNVVEYLNLIPHFLINLQAALLASCTAEELASFSKKKKLPSTKSIATSLGLVLRDFIRNENSVFPFRWAVNCRRVTMIRGFDYALEWRLSTLDTQN